MKNSISNRVILEADYIIETKETIRETAKIFNLSKSTIHKDIRERLKQIDINRYHIIEEIFKKHLAIRHILGGQSTKIKYQKLKLTNEG